VPLPIPCKPESDKESRVHGISAMIEAGQLILPTNAPWLTELKAELLGFPNTRYKDQVDALSQLLAHVRRDLMRPSPPFVGPEAVRVGEASADNGDPLDAFLDPL
jgi:hypothetical protein